MRYNDSQLGIPKRQSRQAANLDKWVAMHRFCFCVQEGDL